MAIKYLDLTKVTMPTMQTEQRLYAKSPEVALPTAREVAERRLEVASPKVQSEPELELTGRWYTQDYPASSSTVVSRDQGIRRYWRSSTAG